MTKKSFVFLFLILIFFFSSCQKQKQEVITINGTIFATTYQIKYLKDRIKNNQKDNEKNRQKISSKIKKELDKINNIFSTYISDSELSKINNFTNLDKEVEISKSLYQVLFLAKKIFKSTDGFFDVTVHPFIKLWGFEKKQFLFPPKKKIDFIKKNIDGAAYTLRKNKQKYSLLKSKQISIDLSAIAKGYAVDQIKSLLIENNINNFLIEIGGEMFANGLKNNSKWKVGIIHPNKQELAKVISLKNRGMATSGDYENFFITNNIRYSHILNPKTGYPIKTSLRSVTVVADSCMEADALATALLAMGDNAFFFAKKHKIKAFFIYQTEEKDKQEDKKKYQYLSTFNN